MDTKVKKRTRTNTPKPRGIIVSYSLRLRKSELARLKRISKRQKISFNTWAVATLMAEIERIALAKEVSNEERREVDSDGEAGSAGTL
jgi:hypothetical protein